MSDKSIAELENELKLTQNMLEYERNKYERILSTQGKGIVQDLKSTIDLELIALRELAEYMPEEHKHRVLRRLDRIDMHLTEFAS